MSAQRISVTYEKLHFLNSSVLCEESFRPTGIVSYFINQNGAAMKEIVERQAFGSNELADERISRQLCAVQESSEITECLKKMFDV